MKTRRNPCADWSFSDEDGMVKMGKLGSAAHGSTVGRGALHRWVMQVLQD